MEENNSLEKLEDKIRVNKNKRKKFLIILVFIIGFFFAYILGKEMYLKSIEAPTGEGITLDYHDLNYNLKEYFNIDQHYRYCIDGVLANNKYEKGLYFLTQIPSRAKKVYTFGNFSDKEDSNNDMAILLEKNDYKSSLLLLISDDCSVLFNKEYDYELPTISSFRKGQKIFLNETKLVPSPTDGVMLHFKNKKTALLYIPNTKTFEEYTQYSEQDLKNVDNERNGQGEYSEGDEDSNDIIYKIKDSDGYANLREQKDTVSMILQKIPSGSIITVLHDNGDWWDIETEQGKRGYVHKSKIISE